MTKMTRQLKIFDELRSIPDAENPLRGPIISPREVMNSFQISLRMLQRDLKDLRDCGLINVKYSKNKDRYFRADDHNVDEDIPERRKQHLLRLYRLGTLITELSRTPASLIEEYESAIISLNELIEMAAEEPEVFTAEDVEIERDNLPDLPPFFDLKAEYYSLFPESNERTRQRDFKELRDAGFEIYYSQEYKTYIFEDDDLNEYCN